MRLMNVRAVNERAGRSPLIKRHPHKHVFGERPISWLVHTPLTMGDTAASQTADITPETCPCCIAGPFVGG